MRRTAAFAVALLTAFLFLVPGALAADPAIDRGRFVLSANGDVTLPAGDVADAVIVIDGTATIAGTVRTLVVIDGTAILTGARARDVVAISSTVELNPGTIVAGDVTTLDSTVHKVGDAAVQGDVTGLEGSLITLGAVLAPAFILFWLGFGLATLVAGLLLAGLAARQVRATERLISHEPVVTLLVGIVGMLFIPVVAILLMITIVGAPLGLGVLFGAWPIVALLGYLVAGIWIGDWLLERRSPGSVRERPYLAAVIGLLILQVVSLLPILSLITAFACVLGFGAVLLAGWRTLTTRRDTTAATSFPAAAPLPG